MTTREVFMAKRRVIATSNDRREADTNWHTAIIEALDVGLSQTVVGTYAGVSRQRIAQIVREENERTA